MLTKPVAFKSLFNFSNCGFPVAIIKTVSEIKVPFLLTRRVIVSQEYVGDNLSKTDNITFSKLSTFFPIILIGYSQGNSISTF